jgi:hypothetical protein
VRRRYTTVTLPALFADGRSNETPSLYSSIHMVIGSLRNLHTFAIRLIPYKRFLISLLAMRGKPPSSFRLPRFRMSLSPTLTLLAESLWISYLPGADRRLVTCFALVMQSVWP